MKNFVNNRSYDELVELQGMIAARMDALKSKHKLEQWAELKEQILAFCAEYGDIEVENKDEICIYINKKADMHEPGRIVGK